jgi:predicted acyl esterase
VPAGATWTQATIPSSDGVKLHADVLRPKGVTAETPVILSIGPYFNHSGQTGPAGPVEGTSYDPVGPSTGPSDRFLDFVEGAKLMERSYAYVMVDLRGFGGSTGCLDWGGPGEQSDALYDPIDATPGPITDDPNYSLNGADDTQRPDCLAANYADQAANDDHDSAYWKARNLIPGAANSNVPLFLTQGLTEKNTVADGTAQYLRNHTGYERAWLGPWEHVRGNETARQRSPTRRSRSRPTTASGAPSRAGRRPTRRRTRRRCAPARTPTTARPTRPATARRRACGRSRRRWRTPSTCRALGAPRSTSRPRCPTPTSCRPSP